MSSLESAGLRPSRFVAANAPAVVNQLPPRSTRDEPKLTASVHSLTLPP
jgi:hypothetical protein